MSQTDKLASPSAAPMTPSAARKAAPAGHPLLKPTAKVRYGDARVTIEYLQQEITLEGTTAVLFGRVMPHLDGQTTIGTIAQRLNETPDRLRRLIGELATTGVITFTENNDANPNGVPGVDFYRLHRAYAQVWLQPVWEHPLWERITSGRASRDQVLGFAFEKYHYIEGAYEHMAIAAANATPEMMPHLARHFIEEYTHGDIYRKGLCSLFSDDIIVRSQPLPSTRALVNFLSETAQRSSFSYYAGNELLQMTENTGDESAAGAVDQFYDAMRAHYPYTEKVINSFIAHTHADQKLGHESVFAEMCESVPPLDRHQVADALETVRAMAEHLVLFLDGIDRCYGTLTSAPRLPSDLGAE
jgi:pyrroloquinoline quinone (PQQ) biosynthesis protein C